MFYAYELFVKKGPLGKVWIAGTVMKKLKKTEIMPLDIKKLCNRISDPPVVLALPTQSTLLRGVCRIENKKAYFLLHDAMDFKTKMLLAGKIAKAVNLPPPKPSEQQQLNAPVVYEEAIDIPLTPQRIIDMFNDPRFEGVAVPDLKALEPQSPVPLRSRPSGVEELPEDQIILPVDEPVVMEDGSVVSEKEEEVETKKRAKRSKRKPVGFIDADEIADQPPEVEEPKKKKDEKEADGRRRKAKIRKPDLVTELSDEMMRSQLNDVTEITQKEARWLKHWVKPKVGKEKKPLIWPPIPGSEKWAPELQRFVADLKPTWIDPAELEGDEEESIPEFEFPPIEDYPRAVDAELESGISDASISRASLPDEKDPSGKKGFYRETLPFVQKPRMPSLGVPSDVSPIPTPHTPVPEKDLDGLSMRVRERPVHEKKLPVINKMTEIFRSVLTYAFEEKQKEEEKLNALGRPLELDFEETLNAAVKKKFPTFTKASRYDVAISFNQLLVLRQLNIVSVNQSASYAPLAIQQGRNWTERFSEPQMYGSEDQSSSE